MENVSAMDPSYEYNAPQFVDFEFGDPSQDENVEDYFNFDHENGQPVIAENFEDARSSLSEDVVMRTPGSKNGTPRRNTPRSCRSTPGKPSPVMAKENMLAPGQQQQVNDAMAVLKKATETGMPHIKPVLTNLCTDVNSWRSKGTINTAVHNNVPRPAAAANKQKRRSVRKSAGKREVVQKENRMSHESPVNKKHKRSASSTATVEPAKRGLKRSESFTGPPKHQRTNSVDAKPTKQQHSRTASVETKTRALSQQRQKQHTRTTSVETKTRALSQQRQQQQQQQHSRTASVEAKTRALSQQRQQQSMAPPPSKPRGRTTSVDNVGVQAAARQGRKNASFDTNGAQQDNGKATRGKLTMPATPSFMKRKPMTGDKPAMLSSEQMELEQIKEKRRDLDRLRKVAEDSHRHTQVSSSYVPKHSVIKPTRPHEFNFATDERIKDHGMATRQDGGNKDFAMQLRHTSPATATDKPLAPTKIQPFNFHERKRKRALDADGKPYAFESMAEKMIAFARKTPDRFRRKPKDGNGPPKMEVEEKPKLTMAKTPNLMCRKRTRTVAVKSQAEIDDEQAEETKRYRFHAQPLNEDIMRGPTGVKKAPKRDLTKPCEFDMETDRRLRTRNTSSNASTSSANKSTDSNDPNNGQRILRANPVPHTGVPFMPKYNHKSTEPKPFSFDDKDRERFAQKDKKIKQVVQTEKKLASEFRAQPIPDLSPQLPSKAPAPATMPEPFQLSVDSRGSHKVQEWSQKLKEEIRQQREAANFHARPNNVIRKKPFLPQKSTKPLTDIDDVELYTERRAEKRAEFEAQKHEHEVELEVQRREMERLREEEERAEYERQRTAAVHKANPIKKFRPVAVKPSSKPLTAPMTPRFSNRIRSKVVDSSF